MSRIPVIWITGDGHRCRIPKGPAWGGVWRLVRAYDRKRRRALVTLARGRISVMECTRRTEAARNRIGALWDITLSGKYANA